MTIAENTIAENKVVTLHYKLTDNEGAVIDQSDDGSFLYLHGAQNIIPGLENALTGKTNGDELSVSVSPEEGYGEHDDSRVASVPRDRFPADGEIEPGMQFRAQSPEGEMDVVTVTEVSDATVTVDSNHPLAGVQLNFEVKIVDIRDATAEELEHGHAHGPEGHHHH
ncbi:MAG TPA: peptidylprolyl isomerase [Gammaproteobacteria bacterium]|nr:peptidylprolyl isomerase [Gammaproteobacteria bacterium]